MNKIHDLINIRHKVYKTNLSRSIGLSLVYKNADITWEYSPGKDKLSISQHALRDCGMYSIVSAISSVDEFIKSITFDALFLYLTQQWTPPSRIHIQKLKSDSTFALLHLMLELAQDKEDLQDAQNLQLISKSIFKVTDKLNYQNYNDIIGHLSSISGRKSKEVRLQYERNYPYLCPTDKIEDTIKYLSNKRHVYVHRLATNGLFYAGDHSARDFERELKSEDIWALKSFGYLVKTYFS